MNIVRQNTPKELLSAMSLLHRSLDEHVMIVDDDEVYVEGLGLVLQGESYRPIGVKSLSEVKEKVLEIKPSVVLMDINLGSESGVEISRQLKSGAATSEIPVIMISGRDDIVERSKEALADYYLEKPFEPRELLEVLGRLVES